jgi:hypothetical protein
MAFIHREESCIGVGLQGCPCNRYTDKKENKIFLILGNSEGSGAKSYMTTTSSYMVENMCAFPHILGTPSSYTV